MFRPILVSLGLLRPRQRGIFLGLVVARVIVQFLDAAGLAAVGLLGAMLASGLTGRQDATFLGVTIEIESSQTFLWVGLAVAGIFFAKSAVATVLLFMTSQFLARVEGRSSAEVARWVFSGDLSRLRNFSRGEIQFAVSTSSSIAFSGLLYAAAALVTEGALFISVFLVLMFVDFSTALILTAYFGLLLATFQLLINRRLRRIGERLSHYSIASTDTLLDLTTAFRETHVLGRKGYYLDRFARFRLNQSIDTGRQRFLQGIPRFFIEAALMMGVVALILWQFSKGNLSEGVVVTGIFITGGLRLMAALLPLQNSIATIRTVGPQATKAHSIIKESREVVSAPDPIPEGPSSLVSSNAVSPIGYAVSCHSVSFHYPDGDSAAVSGISLEIPAGSFCAIVGPSGAGKTTIGDVILGVHNPTSGNIAIDGLLPSELRLARPGSISYVPQRPGVVSGSIAQNVALGIPEDLIDYPRVEESLRMSQLWDFVSALPEGPRSDVGKHSDSLSGGQIQRLGLARALYSRPRLLVLDEATSALDAGTEASIAKTIEQLGAGITTIVIAHRLSTIQNADIVFAVDEGQLLASGTFSEVRSKVPLIDEYVMLMNVEDTYES